MDMSIVKQWPIIGVVFTLCLSGCVANNEMTQVIEHLSQSNKQAEQIIKQLSVKDHLMTELVNDRNKQIKQLMTAQVQQNYYQNLAVLRLAMIKTNSEISELFDHSKRHCLSLVDGEVKGLVELVNSAERQAEKLLQESKKFPEDKTLELQAAKAAADYFGQLNATNSIGENAKATCIEGLQLEKMIADKKLKDFQAAQEVSLVQDRENSVIDISATRFITFNDSQRHFDALLAWTHENEIAYQNNIMYLKTNNLLSSEGVLASVIEGFGQGAIAVVVGKDVVVPSAGDIINSGKLLLDGISKSTKGDFSRTLASAKQGLANIKDNFATNVNEVIQQSVISVLRKKAEQ